MYIPTDPDVAFYDEDGKAWVRDGLAPCRVCGKVHTYHEVETKREERWDSFQFSDDGSPAKFFKIVEDGDCKVEQYLVLYKHMPEKDRK